jgi:hypothetical protein
MRSIESGPSDAVTATVARPAGAGRSMCPSELAELLREAGRRAGQAALRAGSAPTYPSLVAWLVLADVLTARGLMMRLDHDAHETFVGAYQATIAGGL